MAVLKEVVTLFRIFGWSFGVTAVALAGAFWLGGLEVMLLVGILSILEISLSFDNAVINATVLRRMTEKWQKLFLTVGILIAVFGMRLLFPLLIVAITAGLNPVEAVRLAIEHPDLYAEKLHEAHPAIAAFGGMFLAMIFLDFIFEDRDIRWISFIEKPLARLGSLDQLSVIVAGIALLVSAATFASGVSETILFAGLAGIVTYLAVNALASFFEVEADDPEIDEIGGIHRGADAPPIAAPAQSTDAMAAAGKASFFLFLYLEVLDASFSFDGVVGAFAITSNIFIIAVGLGVGAMYIRSLTVFLVRKGTLGEYVYLEHGAHYAIGALAILLMVSSTYDVPEVVTGLIGIAFIGAAFIASLIRRKSESAKPSPEHAAI